MEDDRVEGVAGGWDGAAVPGKKLPSRRTPRPLPPSVRSLEEAIMYLSDQINTLIHAQAVREGRDLTPAERKRVAYGNKLITKYSQQQEVMPWHSDDLDEG